MIFARNILTWYHKYKRDLPWRKTKDPYAIWVSEIILQQTRVDQGMDYYRRFLENFPTVEHLAAAPEQEVLTTWQGLGYYTRARNLHQGAKYIVNELGGIFPGNSKGWMKIKGVGEYTAAAIASITLDEAVVVVDGNVIRVIARLFGIEDNVGSTLTLKKIRGIATELMDTTSPGDFNQALMEFGALYCKPQNPDCDHCIFRKKCNARLTRKVSLIPVKVKAVAQRERYFHYLVMVEKKKDRITHLYLKKREQADIWKNLYDFPLIEISKQVETKRILQSAGFRKLLGQVAYEIKEVSPVYKHILSHQLIYARFYIMEVKGKSSLPGATRVNIRDLPKYPLPRLLERFLEFFSQTV